MMPGDDNHGGKPGQRIATFGCVSVLISFVMAFGSHDARAAASVAGLLIALAWVIIAALDWFGGDF